MGELEIRIAKEKENNSLSYAEEGGNVWKKTHITYLTRFQYVQVKVLLKIFLSGPKRVSPWFSRFVTLMAAPCRNLSIVTDHSGPANMEVWGIIITVCSPNRNIMHTPQESLIYVLITTCLPIIFTWRGPLPGGGLVIHPGSIIAQVGTNTTC